MNQEYKNIPLDEIPKENLETDKEIPPNTFTEMPWSWKKAREQLVEKIHSRIEGLDLEKVKSFISSQNLPLKEYIFFYDEDLPQIQEIFKESGLLRGAFNGPERGVYLPEIDMVLVRREREAEVANGPIFSESMLVHELAHASSEHGLYHMKENGVNTARVGFVLPQNDTPSGWFLEEGFADMIRAKYMEANMPYDMKDKIMKSLNYNASSSLNTTVSMINHASGYQYRIPLKYFYLTLDNQPTTVASAFTGTGLELLCKKNPQLFGYLKIGRKSVEGLRKIANIIESMSPGLYSKLRKLNYTEDEFVIGIKLITESVYEGNVTLNENNEII